MTFEDWLIKNGRAKSTIKKHLIRLKVLERNLSSWSVACIDNFVVNLFKKDLSKSTLNAYIDTIRLYSQYKNLQEELKNYKHYKTTYSIKGTLSDDEIENMISLPCPIGSDEKVWNMYSLLFSILAYTGCRPQEVCTLKRNQIDWGRNVFSIEHTKTGIPRYVPIPPNLIDTIREYTYSIDTDFLFTSRKKQVVSDKSYYHSFKKRKKILCIDRPHITPYSFRHSYATSMLEADVNIHKLAKLLGHSIQQTAHYEHLTTKDLQLAILKHPLVKKHTNPKYIIYDILTFINGYELDKDKRFEYKIEHSNDHLNIRVKTKPCK